MKNLLIFLFGVAFGFGGTMLWLRKDIKEELENIKITNIDSQEEPPFSVDDKKEEEKKPVAVRKETRIAYNNIIKDVEAGKKPEPKIPVMPREDETDGTIVEIDRDTFDFDKGYEQKRLVYFRGDRIMATEEGTIIPNPYILVGGNWEVCVGNYVKNTAFVRNEKLLTDYEIYVEDGLYEDEYGLEVNGRED